MATKFRSGDWFLHFKKLEYQSLEVYNEGNKGLASCTRNGMGVVDAEGREQCLVISFYLLLL